MRDDALQGLLILSFDMAPSSRNFYYGFAFGSPLLGTYAEDSSEGVKRPYIHPGLTHEDGPTVRVELLIGGEITVAVPNIEAVVHLLNKGAGKGLDAAQHAAGADR